MKVYNTILVLLLVLVVISAISLTSIKTVSAEKALTVTVSTDESVYTRGEEVKTTFHVTSGGKPVQGAGVRFTVIHDDKPGMTYNAYDTNSDGKTIERWVNKPIGNYRIKATASKQGYTGAKGEASFEVLKRASPEAKEEEVNCEDFCRKKVGEEHLVWDKKSQSPDCICMCEIGYGEYKDKCVECEKVCQAQSVNDPHYHYDSKTSKPNECACKCDNPYFWDDTKKKCIKCPPNSKPTGTSPCVERVRRYCCCDNGYVASLDGLECLHFTNDAKIDHTLKNAPPKGKLHFVEMPNGKQIKVRVIPNPKRGWDNVFQSFDVKNAKERFKKAIRNPRVLDEPDEKYNCGGNVFGGRKMWIYPRDFPVILTEDNNYRMVKRREIKEGDVAMYYDEGGNPKHVGKIIKASDGSLKVESKFSKYPMCEHEIDDVVVAMRIKFFREFK